MNKQESTTRHTPGPWRLEEDSKSGHCCFEYSIVGNGPTHEVNIAEVIGSYGGDPNLQNARLIAAAPELLDALKDALCALEVIDKQYVYVIDKARLAITKATGVAG